MDPAILARWIGQSETRADTIRAEPANFMAMTLDRDRVFHHGDPLPPLWHWLYFLHSATLSDLGRDGHPALGGFLPPVGLPRRMWAGGRLGFMAPLLVGAEVKRISIIKDVKLKRGRTGMLCFVTVRHEISGDAGQCLWEEHDIVYREDPAAGELPPPPPEAGQDWDIVETVSPSEVMLFRYSALTFNGHRIHYDRDYARDVEGHAGLVVHGPLIATLLADFALRLNQRKHLKSFEYRAISPVYDRQPFSLCARDVDGTAELAATRSDGGLAMHARGTF